MTLSSDPAVLRKFRRAAWGFQQTFLTPLKESPLFVATILSVHPAIESATVTIDSVVFDPKRLIDLLSAHSLPPLYSHGASISANGREVVAALLQAALSDWIDLLFVPTPKPFVIYADHDEYTTIYAATKSNLNNATQPLSTAGFKMIESYTREF